MSVCALGQGPGYAASGCRKHRVVRTNALDDNVKFYRVVQGSRREIQGASVKVASGIWHALGLRADGDRFPISCDGKELFTATDDTFPGAGKLALWTTCSPPPNT
jgi:hypothetical protein